MRAALSLHAEHGTIGAVDASAFDAPSTKQAAEALGGFGEGGRALVVLADGEDSAAKSFRNLFEATVLHVDDVGVADIVAATRLVVSEAALEQLTARAVPK